MSESHNALISFEAFADRLPHRFSQQQCVRLADNGAFPAYTRPAGPKSPPLFLEQSVIAWARDKYFHLIPDYVRALETGGFASVKPFRYDEPV
jgi:hypothetical protein